jgi:hypothetical protein
VKTRPNHYEVLGLKPSATSAEIADAFARENSVFRPNAVGRVAELCFAYETLRDPARRRAYDEALGLKAAPVRRSWSIAAQAKPYTGQMATYAPKPAPPPPEASIGRAPLPAPPAKKAPSARPPVDRQISGSGPVHHPNPEPDAAPGGQPPASKGLPRPFVLEDRDEVGSIEWNRTGQIVGVLVAAAIFIGGFAGWWSGRDAAAAEQPKQAEPAAPASAKKVPSFAEMWGASPGPAKKAGPDRPRRATTATPKVRTADIQQSVLAETEAQGAQPVQEQAIAAEQIVAEKPSAPATTASMPLPDRAVARTIDRIGFSCGKVASAAPVEGASAGTYKVTCTSGQSFQAKPVNGRYRFRRWGRD